MTQKIRAIGMSSGGLDSTLALALMLRQNIEVHAVSFAMGFGASEIHRMAGWLNKRGQAPRVEAVESARQLGLEVEIIDIFGPEYMDMLLQPRHGHGKNFNPCIDCHAFMLRRCGQLMRERDARFVFTGEVLGQRPMSQRRHPLGIVVTDAGLEGLVLRPLSAKLLAPTIPEREGWVDRSQLCDISGRGRTRQLALAQEFGLESWPSPAGGCFLTEPEFARKLRDMVTHMPQPRLLQRQDFVPLILGRYFRLSPATAFVVGREERENDALERLAGSRWIIKAVDVNGPCILLIGDPSQSERERIAAICAGFGKGREQAQVLIQADRADAHETYWARPERGPQIDAMRI